MIKIIFLVLFSITAIAETNISPNMSLPVPIPVTTPGPDWANDINSCMSTIDQHDHTPGYGVQIPPDGLNINSSLSMGGNSLTDTLSVEFTSSGGLSDLQSVYSDGGELYYNDASGNVVQITDGGSVTGASGTITGLPSGTASATYLSSSGTFRFQSATTVPANLDVASIIVREQAASPAGITIKSPTSLSAAYNLTLLTGLPAATSFMMLSSAGAISSRAITAPTTQVFDTGGATGTYTTPSGVLYIKIKIVAGGGSGASSGTAGTSDGTTGDSSNFGGAGLLLCNGGAGGANSAGGGAGGTAVIGAGPSGISLSGGSGQGGATTPASTSASLAGGSGGSSCIGGGGGGGAQGPVAGKNGGIGGGGGGGGASTNTSSASGAGGGAGGCIEAIITSPSATYSYKVADATAGPSAGTNGAAGGNGGKGIILVQEFYQ